MNVLTILLATLAQAAPIVAAPDAPPPSVAAPQVLPAPPADLTTLVDLPLQRRWPDTPALSNYVRDEVRGGRCTVDGNRLRVQFAVLVAANGQIRRIRPVAIQCPTVEQYASGLMSRMARSNVAAPGEDRWYRAAITFEWQ